MFATNVVMKLRTMIEGQNHIAEDDAYAVYSMLEHVEGKGWYWVHIGRTAKPHLQLSRRMKAALGRGEGLLFRKGSVWWFEDEILAKRIHKEACDRLDEVGIERSGDNRAPKYAVSHGNVHSLIHYCAKQAGIRIVSEDDIYRARGLRDARILRGINIGRK